MAPRTIPKKKSSLARDPEPLTDALPLDQQEDITDLDVPEKWYFGPVLWSTDWTTQTIITQLDRGNINLNPRFQRRNAWSPNRKSLFIESLILGLPIPQIILAEDSKRKGKFIIIDGKQRLLSLRQFVSDQGDPDFTTLQLTGLKDREDLEGATYQQLRESKALKDDLNTFENQTIRTVVIRGWRDERYLYSVFLRINTGSVQLSPQELRQALHPGPFTDLIDDLSTQSEILKSVLHLREPDFRMRDVEFVLRYFAYKFFAPQYKGNLKNFLDEATRKLNGEWPKKRDELIEQGEALEYALNTTRMIFGEKDELRKWNGSFYEGRINRAVFDVMAYYFSNQRIGKSALLRADRIKAKFQQLCEDDAAFLSSIETTTKSIEANQVRFGTWAKALQKILGGRIEAPF